MKWILFQTDRGALTGGFRAVEADQQPVSDYSEIVIPLRGRETPGQAIRRLAPNPPPLFRLHGVYRVMVHSDSDSEPYDFYDLNSLRSTLQELASRYENVTRTHYTPLASITAARLKAGEVVRFVEFVGGDWISVRYIPFQPPVPMNLQGVVWKDNLAVWSFYYDVEELHRNKETFKVSKEQMEFAEAFLRMLADIPNPHQHPDVEKVVQCKGTWFRVKVDHLRIIFELDFTHKRLTWRMILKRRPDTYETVANRFRSIYPPAQKHPKVS